MSDVNSADAADAPPSSSRARSVVIGLRPLLVDADDAAALLGISPASFWRLHSASRIPAPTYLGERQPRWSVAELEQFIASGAKNRDEWEKFKRAQADGSARGRRS